MKSNKGSALLVAILLSAILLAALGGLLTVALNEYRGSLKSYFDTAAFSLAEAGIDRAAAAIADKDNAVFSGAEEKATWPDETTSTPVWYKKTSSTTDTTTGITTSTTTYRGYFPTENLEKGRSGACSVIVTPLNATEFEVYAQGTVVAGASGELASARALHVKLTKTTASSQGVGYALAAVNEIELATADTPVFKQGDSTGFPRIASYDSSKGSPNLWTDITSPDTQGILTGTNVGDDAMIAVKSGTMKLQNAIIYGKIGLAAGASLEKQVWNGMRKELYGQKNDGHDDDRVTMNTAVLVNLDIAKENAAAGVYRGFNSDENADEMDPYDQGREYNETELKKVADSCILTNYGFEDDTFATPDRTKLSGYKDTATTALEVKDSEGNTIFAEITQNTTILDLDASKSTYYTNSDRQAFNDVQVINVSGTVLLYAPQAFKAEKGLQINYKDSSSKLIIFSDGAVRINMSNCPTYTDADGNSCEIAPKQFEINVANGSEVDIKCKTGVFAGIVKAPASTISVSSSGSGGGRTSATAAEQMAGRLQLRGQFIAYKIKLSGSNNLDILYDVQTKGSTTTSDKITVASWKQILPSTFAAQL